MSALSNSQFETYYHRTDPDSAGKILQSGKLKPSSAEHQVFVSDILKGRARAFGKSVIEVQIPKKAPKTDYSSDYGEKWYGVSPRDVKIVRGWTDLG